MEYINYLKAKAHVATAKKSDTPVLSEEDEKFLNQITSQENPPPLEIKDAQLALMDGAQNIPLPETPGDNLEEPPAASGADARSLPQEQTDSTRRKTWSWLRRDSRDARNEQRQATAAGLDDIAANLKKAEAEQPDEEKQAKREEEDMTIVLERLNLAAINNRVFSISDDTQELLQKFNVVFKDLVNGVPTAYDDLESLLTNGDRQLQKTFNSLPSFLQRLIEKLPETMTKGFAPEMMAAATERAQKSGINVETAGKAAAVASKLGLKTPSLKELVGKPAAITGMLRSIFGYLRARFPAFMGMNVLWSLALFVLLFVFWYCYKRGKETRLEKEQLLTEEELAKLDAKYERERESQKLPPSAEPGATMDEVKADIMEVEAAKAAARPVDPAVDHQSEDPKLTPPTSVPK